MILNKNNKNINRIFIYITFLFLIILSLAHNSVAQTVKVSPSETVYPLDKVPQYPGEPIAEIVVVPTSKALGDSGRPSTPLISVPIIEDRFWPADAVVATLKKDANTLYWFWSEYNFIQRYEGPLSDPRKTALPYYGPNQIWDFFKEPIDPNSLFFSCWKAVKNTKNKPLIEKFLPDYGCVWLKNIYKISNNTLLGFTHNEVFKGNTINVIGSDRRYSIGLSYSEDNGVTWAFLGEIIKPKHDIYFDINSGRNIFGAPYLVVGDYFYVYFQEHPTDSSGQLAHPTWGSVARAKITDVIAAAKNGTVTSWNKYFYGNWNQSALSGEASNILWPSSNAQAMNICSDAVKIISPSGNSLYALSAMEWDGVDFIRLTIHFSTNGIDWDSSSVPAPVIVTSEAWRTGEGEQGTFIYSFFAALDGANDDCSIVSNEFYIYYPRNEKLPWHYAIMRNKINIY